VRDGFHYKFWVYILSSRSGTLYVGITGFFDQRIHQHKYDSIEGFTKTYQCHRLVYYESYRTYTLPSAARKANQALGPGKEDLLDRKDKSALAGSGGELGPGDAVPGTILWVELPESISTLSAFSGFLDSAPMIVAEETFCLRCTRNDRVVVSSRIPEP